jgi:sortase A
MWRLIGMRTRRLETILLAIGSTLLAAWGGVWIYSSTSSRMAIRRFQTDRDHTLELTSASVNDPASGAAVDFTLWSPKRVAAYKESVIRKTDVPLALLYIRKIGLEVPVYNDTDDLTLDRGVGRIVGTAQIGEVGNVGIAGHRDGFFRGLKDLGPNDEIELVQQDRTETYVVDRIQLVDPKDVSVLKPTPTPSLTLVTCFPFYYIGSAPQRYIVQASMKATDRVHH